MQVIIEYSESLAKQSCQKTQAIVYVCVCVCYFIRFDIHVKKKIQCNEYILFFFRTIAVWNFMKKKPLVSCKHHQHDDSEVGVVNEYWVTSVAALPNTDLVASGKVWSKTCVM